MKYGYRLGIGFAIYENAKGVNRSAAGRTEVDVYGRSSLQSRQRYEDSDWSGVASCHGAEEREHSRPRSRTSFPAIGQNTRRSRASRSSKVLSHTSGFRNNDGYKTFDGLRNLIKAGVKPARQSFALRQRQLCAVPRSACTCSRLSEDRHSGARWSSGVRQIPELCAVSSSSIP